MSICRRANGGLSLSTRYRVTRLRHGLVLNRNLSILFFVWDMDSVGKRARRAIPRRVIWFTCDWVSRRNLDFFSLKYQIRR